MKLLIGSAQYVNAVNKDYQIEVMLESTANLIDEDVITKIIDETTQFQSERNSCHNYLLYGKVEHLIDDTLNFTNYSLNENNYDISIGYVINYEVLDSYKTKINSFSGNTLFIDNTSNLFFKDDIILIYKDSQTLHVNKILDANSTSVTVDKIPTGITVTDFYLIPSVAQYKRLFSNSNVHEFISFYNSGFSVNIFGDVINQFNTHKNFDLTHSKDVFGRPITEIFLNITKKYTVSNNYYENSRKTESNSNVIDIVEFDLNNLTIKTTDNLITSFTDKQNYYYNTWYSFPVKVFSNQVTNSTINTDFDYPDYAFQFNDGDLVYKKLLDVGYFENSNNGINYPFMNNMHYLYKDIKFSIRNINTASTVYPITIDPATLVYNNDYITPSLGGGRLC